MVIFYRKWSKYDYIIWTEGVAFWNLQVNDVKNCLFQIFFDDSVRNIASGKAAGLHTVIVSKIRHIVCVFFLFCHLSMLFV